MCDSRPKDNCNPEILTGALAGIANTAAGKEAYIQKNIDRIDIKNGCIGKTCICSSNDDVTKNCYNLKVPEGKTVLLRGNYQGYASCLLTDGNVNTNQLPEDIRGAYTQFVIDKNAVKYLELIDKSKGAVVVENEEKPNAILPIIVEKITLSENSVAIIVSPDSDRIRGRVFYLYQCPEKNSAKGCEKQTGASSITTDKDGTKYCAPSLTTEGCTYQTLSSCKVQCGLTNQPCLCGAATEPEKKGVATYGLCVNIQAHVAVNCEAITKCEDYPLQDGDPKITRAESWSCGFDACNVAPPGMQCQFGPPSQEEMDSLWNQIKSIGNEEVFGEQCTPARQSQVRARLSCNDK